MTGGPHHGSGAGHAVLEKLRVGETPSSEEFHATLVGGHYATQSSLESTFRDIIRALLEDWQPGHALACVGYVVEGLKLFKASEPSCVAAAGILRRCLLSSENAAFVTGLLEKHEAAVAVLAAALQHPQNRPLYELALAFGDAAKTDAERKTLAESHFFQVALSQVQPGMTKVRVDRLLPKTRQTWNSAREAQPR